MYLFFLIFMLILPANVSVKVLVKEVRKADKRKEIWKEQKVVKIRSRHRRKVEKVYLKRVKVRHLRKHRRKNIKIMKLYMNKMKPVNMSTFLITI